MAKKAKNFEGAGADLFLTQTPEPVPISTDNNEIKELKINETFKELIPKLADEEYAQLESNLKENGIREPISIWENTIIDGHNRYEIAMKYNLPFKTESYNFENESDAILWIIKNQLGRRNMSAYDRSILALRLKPVIAEKAKEKQSDAGGALRQKSDKAPIDTKKELAELAGVSHDTISKVEKIEQQGTPEIIERIKRGDISIHGAYQAVKNKEKKHTVITQSKPKLPNGKFDVILADPLYEYGVNEGEDSSPKFHSLVTLLDEVKNISIPVESSAVLFLWATYPLLPEVMKIMTSWGFKYKSQIVWDKEIGEKSYWVKEQHEVLLIGAKGNFEAPMPSLTVESVYREQRKNNEKPAYFYTAIEKMFPNGKYLELFSNKPHSERWTVWSNQVESEDNKK